MNSDIRTLQVLPTEDAAAFAISRADQDALADRMAVVLNERKKIAQERLKREREKRLQTGQRACERYQVRVRVREVRVEVNARTPLSETDSEHRGWISLLGFDA